MKRKPKIGETKIAMDKLNMTMEEIKLHNAYASGWNDAQEICEEEKYETW